MKSKLLRHTDQPASQPRAPARIASLLAALAVGAGSMASLSAACLPIVIDDMSGPEQKYRPGGGGMDYLTATLVNGQLVFSGQFPATPPNNPAVTYDNIYWPGSLPGVSLDDHTLEVRMDLVRASADDVFLDLGVGGPFGNSEGGYYVARDQNEVFLMKYGPQDNTLLFIEDAPVGNQNITVVLTLARSGNALLLNTQLKDKDSGSVLYERSFIDGPGRDALVPSPAPKGIIGFFSPDSGPPVSQFNLAWAGVWHYAASPPPPLELTVDNLEYRLYDTPALDIAKSVLLSWSQDTTEEQIVVGATSIDGPWVPSREPIFKRQGEVCVAVPITFAQQWTHPEQYFRLAPGGQLGDNFSEPDGLETACFPDGKIFELRYLDGTLRIVGPTPSSWGRAYLGVFPLPAPARFLHADFSMSVDILDWDKNAAAMDFGIAARSTPPPNCSQVTESYAYMGLLSFSPGAHAQVFIYGHPPNGPISRVESIALDLHQACRLVFSGVGNQLTFQLFDLGNLGTPLVQVEATNNALSQGVPGLWAFANNSAYDLTIDNYVVSGTKP